MLVNKSLITAAAFASIALNGIAYAFVGTSLPAIRTYLGIDLEMAAVLTAAIQAGFTISSLFGGILSDLIRRDKVLMTGCLVLGTAGMLLGGWTDFWVNFCSVLAMGVGSGLIVSSSNVLLVDLYPERRGTILNVHHVFFGLGSLVGPLLMGFLLLRPDRWRTGYLMMGALLIGLFLFFNFTRVPSAAPRNRRLFGSAVGRLLRDRYYGRLLVVSATAIGSQFALMLLSVTFLQTAKGLPVSSAGVVLSFFFVCLVAGRLLCSRLSMNIRNASIILMLLALQFLTLLAAWVGSSPVAVVALILSGLACSGIYPGLLALAGSLFGEISGSALGILSTLGGMGGILVCWLTGVVSHRTVPEMGFMVPTLSSLVALALFGFSYRTLKKREATAGRRC